MLIQKKTHQLSIQISSSVGLTNLFISVLLGFSREIFLFWKQIADEDRFVLNRSKEINEILHEKTTMNSYENCGLFGEEIPRRNCHLLHSYRIFWLHTKLLYRVWACWLLDWEETCQLHFPLSPHALCLLDQHCFLSPHCFQHQLCIFCCWIEQEPWQGSVWSVYLFKNLSCSWSDLDFWHSCRVH